MVGILDLFKDVVLYPMYQLNLTDSFMGILCSMLFVVYLLSFVLALINSVKKVGVSL